MSAEAAAPQGRGGQGGRSEGGHGGRNEGGHGDGNHGERGRRDGPADTSRQSVAFATYLAGLREYRRTPVLLALFVFLPAYLIGAFTRLVPSTTSPLDVPGGGTIVVEMTDVYAVIMAPMVGALVGALAGVFLMQTARESDARLVVAGARPTAVLLARVALLGTVGALVSVVAVGTTATTYVPERPLFVGVAVLLAALVYGLLGVLAGLVVDRLAGVYLALFGTMIDLFLVQNPLADPPAYAPLLPGHAPVVLATDAGFSSDVALATLGEGVAYLAVVGTLTAVALYRTMRVR